MAFYDLYNVLWLVLVTFPYPHRFCWSPFSCQLLLQLHSCICVCADLCRQSSCCALMINVTVSSLVCKYLGVESFKTSHLLFTELPVCFSVMEESFIFLYYRQQLIWSVILILAMDIEYTDTCGCTLPKSFIHWKFYTFQVHLIHLTTNLHGML